MVHETIAAGADPNRPDNRGWTPLHFAAQAQSAAVIEALLLAEAHVDAVDSHGNTPRELARTIANYSVAAHIP